MQSKMMSQNSDALPAIPSSSSSPSPPPAHDDAANRTSALDPQQQELAQAMDSLMKHAMQNSAEQVPADNGHDVGPSGTDGQDAGGDAGGLDALIPPEVSENLAIMDPDNPLMKRVQDALYKQLTSADERLTLEIREKEEALRKTRQEREQVGVELYALQQQLAKLQQSLEDSHATYAVIKSHRERADQLAADTRAQYNKQKADLTAAQRALEARKQELETLSRTLAQVQLFQEEMKSKLSTTRRVTLKSEEDLLKQEAEKRKQDFYIHQLSQRVERLQDQRATVQHQINVQQQEIRALHSAIQEANTEMDAIVFEKRQLLLQWKSGLIGMQRRQEVLSAMESAIKNETEKLLTMDTELTGFKTALKNLAIESETLSLLESKLNTESDYLSDQLKQIADRRDLLRQQYASVQRALEAAEADAKKLAHQRQGLVNEVNALKKQILTKQQRATKLEKEIAEQIQHQITIDKGMAGTLKDAKKLTQAIHDKEAEVAASENQVSVLKLEGSRVVDAIRQLRSELSDLDKTIADKNGTIEKYEVEIRRGNDEMVKKQSEIDLLNKKLNQIMQDSSDEAIGPLEATIHNLSKSIAAKEKECWDLQHFWLRTQNDLVAASKKASEMTEQISTLKMRHTILTRKRAMINQEFDAEEAEIKVHNRSIKALQNDMIKMNTLLYKQSSLQASLGESTLGLEQEFRYRLKEAELEAIHLEQQVKNLKSEKDNALSGLIDMEQQIMLWEKKIQLAKETREALDPNIGAQEIQEMTAEIHRMELRLANLQKVQEKLITDMEKAVVRRETIAVRAKLRGKGYTQASLNKAISELNRQLKGILSDLKDVDRDIGTLNEALSRVRTQVGEAYQVLLATRRSQASVVAEIQERMDIKMAYLSEVAMWQKRSKKLQTVKDAKYAWAKENPEERRAEAAKGAERLDKVEKALHLLMTECADELGPTTRCLDVYLKSARSFVGGSVGGMSQGPPTQTQT